MSDNTARSYLLLVAYFNLAFGHLTNNNNNSSSSVPFTIDCVLSLSSREYVGTLNVTEAGLPCQPWTSNKPHRNYFISGSSTEFPGDGSASGAGNKCRNPDTSWNGRPWCYTQSPSVRWQHCNVPMCECKLVWDVPGANYLGLTSTTRTGKLCQHWNSSSPHQHAFMNSTYFRDASVASASNYCRNPNTSRPDGPWCYTQDPTVEWEYCFVPVCNFTAPDISVETTLETTRVTQRQTTILTTFTTLATSTVRRTRSTRRPLPPTEPSKTDGDPSTPRADKDDDVYDISSSVLVPAVVTPIVIIILIVVMVIAYLYCYRGHNMPCDVRITPPWNRTNAKSEQLGENALAKDPDVHLAEAPKGSRSPGFDNPIYDIPVSASVHNQPSTSVEPDVESGHDTENQYVTMSQIQLT